MGLDLGLGQLFYTCAGTGRNSHSVPAVAPACDGGSSLVQEGLGTGAGTGSDADWEGRKAEDVLLGTVTETR